MTEAILTCAMAPGRSARPRRGPADPEHRKGSFEEEPPDRESFRRRAARPDFEPEFQRRVARDRQGAVIGRALAVVTDRKLDLQEVTQAAQCWGVGLNTQRAVPKALRSHSRHHPA